MMNISNSTHLLCILDSDVLHLRLSGRSIVILNSAKAAVELLEKRSAIYSDRYGNC